MEEDYESKANAHCKPLSKRKKKKANASCQFLCHTEQAYHYIVFIHCHMLAGFVSHQDCKLFKVQYITFDIPHDAHFGILHNKYVITFYSLLN